jgi:hypothetical protein
MIKTMRGVALAALSLAAIPMAMPAGAGPYVTAAVYQASGTPSPPADGDSPFASCDISGLTGPGETNYLNAEVSPQVAVNPTDPSNIIGVYWQDPWSRGSGRGAVAAVSHDGGQTWAATFPTFSICAGGTASNGGDFQRARDQWVTFAPNGDAYFTSRPVDVVGADREIAVSVSKSTDGGDHWSQPVVLVRNFRDVVPFYNNQATSVTADPFDSNFVYAVWNRTRKPGDAQSTSATHSFAFRGDTMFSRTTDGGQTWEDATAIVKYQQNSGTFANQLGVLPDGTLVVIFDNLQGAGSGGNGFDIKVIRSTDRGQTWSQPIEVAPDTATPCQACHGPVDPDTGKAIRVSIGRADLAVDLNPSSAGYGTIYAVWEDTVGSPKKTPYPTVVFTESTDGGFSWSPPIKVNQSPAGVHAFTPEVDVASDGTVAVTYHDFRNNTADPGVPTDLWMIHCHATADCTDPANWAENHVAGPFDIEQAPDAGGYFLGDHTGLASIGTTFLSFFTQTTGAGLTNTYLARITP